MDVQEDPYELKKKREQDWYAPKVHSSLHQLLRNPIVFSYDRIIYSYNFPKKQMVTFIQRHHREQPERTLNAPSGRGDDHKYLIEVSRYVFGLDLSPMALNCHPEKDRTSVGDILHLPYSDSTFDLVVSPLFFHHLLRFGFLPFLMEFYRVLKPGGAIVILEPSLWYPINIITRPIKRFLGNPYDEVEDESPFPPSLMMKSLKVAGFTKLDYAAASFSHPVFYIPFAKLVNSTTKFLLHAYPFKNMGWMVLYWAQK